MRWACALSPGVSMSAVLLLSVVLSAAPVHAEEAPGEGGAPAFDRLTLVLLERGPAWSAEPGPEAEERQAAHIAHLQRMWDEGHAEVCGPVAGEAPDQQLRGVCLYRTDRAEALELAGQDPAVKSEHLRVVAHDWYFGADHLAFPQRLPDKPHHGGSHGAHEPHQAHGGGRHAEGPRHGASDRATVSHRFDEVDRWVKVFDDPARDEWQKPEVLVAALGIPKKAVVADIGAGTGYFNPHLAAAVGRRGRVIAVDVERSLVDHMVRRAVAEGTPQVEPRLGRFEDPGLLPGEADLILMVDTYHHIDRRKDYFARLRAALAPGGRLVIVDFKQGELPVGPPPDHRIAPEVVEAELTAVGYQLVAAPELLPHQFVRVFQSSVAP